MKKTFIYSMAAFAGFALASCNGDYDDWASPQAYGKEDAAAKYGVSFSAGPEANSVMPDEDGEVHLVTVSSSNDGVSGFTLKTLSINGEAVNGTMVGNDIVVNATDLEKLAMTQNDSRAAVARDLDVKATVSINMSSGDAVVADVEGDVACKVTPHATPSIDPQGYYLLGNFKENGSGWNLKSPVWMTSNGDGTYTATVNTTGDGDNWFKFYSGSRYSETDWDVVNAGQMGCEVNGDKALHNFVVYEGDPLYGSVQTAVISGQGQFNVTLDMNNLTYTVTRAESMYYIVGNINNPTWSADACIRDMLYAEGGNIYSYTTQWNGAWDLKIWESKNIGDWSKAWGTAVDGDGSASGALINSSSNSFQAPAKGYYTLTVNMNDNTYTWTKLDNQAPAVYTHVSLIGDFNSWGGDVDMTQEANAPHNWYARVTIPSDGGLKFRANHGWDVSWGTSADDKSTAIGDVYYLSTGGENITVPAGTYDFYLNDITGRWNIVPVK